MKIFLKSCKLWLLMGVSLSALLFLPLSAEGQVKYHDSGDIYLQIFGGGYFSYEWNIPNQTMRFPNGWDLRDNVAFYSVWALTDYDIVLDDQGSLGTNGVWPGHTQENNNKPISIKKYYRYRPPSVMVDEVLLTPYFDDELDPTLPCDQKIEINYVMNSEVGQGYPGLAITQRSYSFVNENHSQYVIFDVNYQYTQQSGLNPDEYMPDNPLDAWLGILYGFQPCKIGARKLGMYGYFGGWDEQDDIATHIVAPSQYSSTRDELVVSYAFDGDSPDYDGDDMGDPDPVTGEFLSPQYVGFTFLHVDKSVDDETDDPSNPYTIGVNQMDELWYDNNEWAVEYFNTGTFYENDEIMPYLPCNWQATKQYQFEKNDDAHIVYALGGATGLSIEEAKTEGEKWLNGQITDADKNALLEEGVDELVDVLDRAAWCWERGMSVPAPPPSPDIVVTSGPDEILIEWSDVSDVPDPVTDNLDFAGYRVYRAIGSRDTTYTQIYEGTANSYVDTEVTRGIAYYYYVTAFDDGSQNTDGLTPGQSLESSKFLNRMSVAAYAFKPGSGSAQGVLVVPNPFDRSGAAVNFPGEPDKILFVNLPPICTIRIFTVSGHLIKTIPHTSGSGDEAWDLVTAFNQYVASGVYIYRIDDAKTWDGKTLESSHGKFIVVR